MDKSIESRLDAIEARLAKLEGVPQPTTEVPAYLRRHEETLAERPQQPVSSIQLTSSNWLAMVAVVCFIFASGLIIKLAITSGWLTQMRQIALSYLLGVGLITVGLQLLQAQKAYASYLPSAGVTILYLTTFAASSLYGIFPFLHAILLTCIISCVTILLYYKINHDIYLLIAALGTYLAPIMLRINIPDFMFAPYFYVVCSLAFATVSIVLSSRLLCMISAYAAILATTIIADGFTQQTTIAIVLALHFAIFSIATLLYSIAHRTELSKHDAWCFFPVLMLFYVVEYYTLYHINADIAPWIALDFAGFMSIMLTIGWWRSKWQSIPSETMLLSFISIILFHAFYIELLPTYLDAWLVLALMIGYMLLPNKQRTPINFENYFIPIGLFLILALCEYAQALMNMATGSWRIEYTLSAFAIYATFWVVILGKDLLKQQKSDPTEVLLCFMHILGIAILYRFFKDVNALAISASWLCYALIIFGIANQCKSYLVAKSALLILCIAAFKALIIDASSAPTYIRILCLLVTGAVLYYAGILLKRFSKWR